MFYRVWSETKSALFILNILNLKNSFLVIIIQCGNLNKNCFNLLSFVDLYMNEKFLLNLWKIREFVFPVFNTSQLSDTVSTDNFIIVSAAYFC